MSHPPYKYIDDNECSGPRPPVPGEESRVKKMTEGVSKSSSPSYLNWARTLTNLLEDRDGVELFKRYVEEEASMYNDHLNFYFACEGLKQQTDPEKVKQVIAAIYRFLRKSRLTITEDLRKTIKAGLKNEIPLNRNIYDSLQLSTLITIREKIYGSFLTSEMYIKYIQQMSAAQERCDGNISMVNVASGSGFGGSSSVLYGPSTSASSSGSGSATETLPRSSILPILHEDTELSICDDFDSIRVSEGRLPIEMPLRLTEDLLRATQKRRLEIRPPGAHGYVYTANTSYNPNSRVDSERQSCSSGGRTDSDKVSLSSFSLDGRPYPQKRHTTESKAMRQNALANKETNNFQVIPRTQRLHSNEHQFKEDQFILLLMPKLEEVKWKQDLEERAKLERSQEESTAGTDSACLMTTQGSDRALADAIRQKFALDDGNDQDILDQHVSRVWKDQTPHRSPGTISPCRQQTRRRTTTHDSGMLSDGTLSISGHSMRHSKSMPENSSSSRKIINKWPSMNTDSGISLFSADTLMKYKDTNLRSGSSTAFQLEEAKRRLENETRRSRRHSQHPSPLPMPSMSSNSSGSSTMQQPPPLPARPQETTTVVFSFCDEEFPYRTKIPGTQPTLKQFKDYLPKKRNFRFFFKTHCEDPESPVIQEEIANDSDILPLFEGKVMGIVKPSD